MRPDGTVIADSRVREGPSGAVSTEPLPPAAEHGPIVGAVGWIYDKVMNLLPHETPTPLVVDMTPGAGGLEWQPDVKEELRLNSSGQSREMPPYIRRTKDNQLLVTVAEPVERDRHTVGIILLTRDAREVETSLFVVRISILGLFGLALGLTVLLSWYLSLTIARPILRLAGAAAEMREGHGRPEVCLRRCCNGATRWARWPRRCLIRRRRCSRGWTRSRSSPPTWRTRSRIRCPQSAARSRRCDVSRIRSGRSSC